MAKSGIYAFGVIYQTKVVYVYQDKIGHVEKGKISIWVCLSIFRVAGVKMISIIVAKAQNNIIGGNNKLLWHISDDLKRFKEITSGNIIIMGRKTFESLPGVLPNRKHIILTRDKNFSVDNENVEVIHNADQIINNYKNSPVEAFIIGGGEIYKEFLPHANNLYLTEVLKDFEGDTSFPQVNLENWVVDYSSDILTNAKDGLQYKFINYIKKS